MVTELAAPLTVRRAVAVSTAVTEGRVDIEGLVAERVDGPDEAVDLARSGRVPVLVSPGLPGIDAAVVVDARLAKRNIDTTLGDADLVIGIGPGFTPLTDCDAVVETARGHHLGRVLWDRPAAPDTGRPAPVRGHAAERVLRAPAAGTVAWKVAIGDAVRAGALLGVVGGQTIRAPFDGMVRGLIWHRTEVAAGTKIGDIDPRGDRASCFEVSDKALAIGGGVLEAVGTWRHRVATGRWTRGRR